MQVDKKVSAAIAAAIELYLLAESRSAGPVEELRRIPGGPVQAYSPWGPAGRQSAMNMRQFLQMRVFR